MLTSSLSSRQRRSNLFSTSDPVVIEHLNLCSSEAIGKQGLPGNTKLGITYLEVVLVACSYRQDGEQTPWVGTRPEMVTV